MSPWTGGTIRAFGWRLLYGAIEHRLAVAVTALLIRLVAVWAGATRADGVLSAFERRFVFSGWPHHRYGWVNLHLSRFVVRVRRFWSPHPAVAAATIVSRAPLRVGCVGRFRGLLSFPRALFAAFPPTAELHLFDLEYGGECAGYLSDLATNYVPIKTAPGFGAAAAAAINAAQLDVLINANSKSDAYELLDHIETPCVLNFCPGSDLLHHERVAFNLHGQPQADYFAAGRHMFCGTTRAYFDGARVFTVRGYYDPRGIALQTFRPWSARKPLIVYHGSLYKLANEEMLDTLCRLLADAASVDFVIMGKDRAGALDRIKRAASRHSVSSRVHYEGVFDSTRAVDGAIGDTGWTRLQAFLGDARLAPDPWPIGGGSSRFEAFAMGAPSVHMGVRFDPDSWGRPQPSIVDVPHMMIRDATAWSIAEYRTLCERCLGDEGFASVVMQRQFAIARELSDPEQLWRQVFAAYAEWLESTGASAAHVDPAAMFAPAAS